MDVKRRAEISVIMLVLATGSPFAAGARSADDLITGATATWVTLIDQSCSTEDTQPVEDGALQRVRGARTSCEIRFDDARVSGTVTTTGNYDCHAETGCVTWGQQEIVGPDGAWSGSFSGLIDPAFTERAIAVLTGTGGYAGLTLVIHGVGSLDETPAVVGLIYEGDAPPS